MFDRVQFLPTSYFDHQATGTLLSKFSYDVGQVTGAAVKSLRSLVEDTSKIIFLLVVMFINNWKLTLLFIIVVPFIAAVVGIPVSCFESSVRKCKNP